LRSLLTRCYPQPPQFATDMAQRFLGNLQVYSTKARELLGCSLPDLAPFGFEAGVADMFGANGVGGVAL
jgi:hypothetical protein